MGFLFQFFIFLSLSLWTVVGRYLCVLSSLYRFHSEFFRLTPDLCFCCHVVRLLPPAPPSTAPPCFFSTPSRPPRSRKRKESEPRTKCLLNNADITPHHPTDPVEMRRINFQTPGKARTHLARTLEKCSETDVTFMSFSSYIWYLARELILT